MPSGGGTAEMQNARQGRDNNGNVEAKCLEGWAGIVGGGVL